MSTTPAGDRNFRKRFKTFDPEHGVLPRLMHELLREQAATWQRVRAGIDSLRTVRLREVHCSGFTVKLQFNPGRIVSTAAKVDPRSIRERPCFLCLENLPPEQSGIAYRDEFVILCNPAPIFSGHYTVSHLGHKPQLLGGAAGIFLDLARDFSPDFSVFYNGPKCGASAPDHLHFQASPAGAIPLELEAVQPDRRSESVTIGGAAVATMLNVGRQVIVMEGRAREAMEDTFTRLLVAMQNVMGSDDEPMMNVICSYNKGAWRLMVFPRSRHRPAAFSGEGEGGIMVSPAAVDMGGLVITPREQDFLSLSPSTLEGILAEVSVRREVTDAIVRLLEEGRS